MDVIVYFAAHSAALMAEAATNGVKDHEQVKTIVRNLVDKIIYEKDRSGYFFVYEGTIAVAFPVKKESVGKDLGGVTDKNGKKVIQEVNENVNQSSTVAAEITRDIAVVNQSSSEIA